MSGEDGIGWGEFFRAYGLLSNCHRKGRMNVLADIENFLALLGRLLDGWCLRRRLEDCRRPHRACQAPDPEPGM